jgi:hypothetical protein
MSDVYCDNCNDPIDACTCGDTEIYSSVFAVCPYCGHDNDPDESEGFLYNEDAYSTRCGGHLILTLGFREDFMTTATNEELISRLVWVPECIKDEILKRLNEVKQRA